jgi:hypothetical protein
MALTRSIQPTSRVGFSRFLVPTDEKDDPDD